MPARELGEYPYRGARALVLLRGTGMRGYLPAWRAARRAGLRGKLELPDPGIEEPLGA